MLTDIIIRLHCQDWAPVQSINFLGRRSHMGVLVAENMMTSSIEHECKLAFPEKLHIAIDMLPSQTSKIHLAAMKVGTIWLSDAVLSQICRYQPINQPALITRDWFTSGSVIIDFFAGDWVQYHLLYGNKIGY